MESLKNFRTFYLLTEICKSFRSFWTPSLKTHILWAVSLGSPFSRLSVIFFTSPEQWTKPWHIISLLKGDSSLFKWRAISFSKGKEKKKEEQKHQRNLKNIFSRTTGSISTKLSTKHHCLKVIHDYSNKPLNSLHQRFGIIIALRKCVNWLELSQVSDVWPMGILFFCFVY